MIKFLIPTLAIALGGNSVASAQYFGTKYPASSSYSQPARPIRIARATDPVNTPSDSLDELDALDALDAPATSDAEEPAPAAPERSLHAPPTLDEPSLFDMPESLDVPEQLELPDPSKSKSPASLDDSESVQPEISAQDLESIDSVDQSPALAEPTLPATPIPGQIDLNSAIEQQQHDLSLAQQPGGPATSDCGCSGSPVSGCRSCMTPMPYQAPILPPANSFHGHFRANPCYFDIWANYPAEAAAACAHNRAKLAPPIKTGCQPCQTGCQSCQLVAPCHCR